MKTLLRYEFRKLWNRTTYLTIMIALLYSVFLMGMNCLYYADPVVTGDGQIVSGIQEYRVVQKESEEIAGTVNQEYMDNLVEKYNTSVEKTEFSDMIGKSIMKYQYSNYLFTFAQYCENSNNSYLNLDYPFMKSDVDFYQQYRTSAVSLINQNAKQRGMIYTDEQQEKLKDKADELKLFKVGYYGGLQNIILAYGEQYFLILVILAFTLCGLFSNDSSNGLDELMLASSFGKSKLIRTKMLAGNLFAAIIYFVYLFVLLLVNGLVATLDGFTLSIQNFWYSCLNNMSLGQGMFLMFAQGFVTVLLIANLIMLFSMCGKKIVISLVASLLFVYVLCMGMKMGNGILCLLNPLYYATRLTKSNLVDFDVYYFIGNHMMSYSRTYFIGVVLVVLMIWMLLKVCIKHYHWR